MTLESPAFAEGATIPVRFTCDGANVSPELDVISPPSGTAAFAIVVDDPDAPVGTWDHWVEYDIPLEDAEDQVWVEDVGLLGVRGVNSWNLPGYGGPCPPEGQNHRYFFTVYALDKQLLAPEGLDSGELRAAMEGHIIGEAQLMGTYSR
jgi:Raf kinase inhibitor-like YbhB/YbcL family protein